VQGSHVQFVHLQLGFEQFGSIVIVRKSNIKIYITQSIIFSKLKISILLIAGISLVIGILAYQSFNDQMDEIIKIIRDSQAGLGQQRYSREQLQQMNDNAEITLMFARGLIGFSVSMAIYALYEDIIKIIRRVK
tara:strand:+ start:215 stop:616 length:402 start_codon:yes stop_codon:yes gene_type:complete